jgi:hypothetical protein
MPPNYELAAERAARRHGIDPRIFKAMIRQESGFRENVGSSAGARDIAQFIPSTAKAYGVTLGDNKVSDDLDGAARYLKANLEKYGSYHQALSAYNSGRPDAYKDPGFAKGQTYNYVRTILGNAKGEKVSGGPVPAGSSPQRQSGSRTVRSSRTIPGVDNSEARNALILNFLGQRHNPQALVSLASGLKDAQDTPSVKAYSSKTVSTPSSASPSAAPSDGKTTTFDGKTVVAWMVPALKYARAHGWTGKVISGVRSHELQSQLYADFKAGRRAGPVAVPGESNHEIANGGAVDVSDPYTLARIMAHYSGRKLKQGTAIGDPPHFSATGR